MSPWSRKAFLPRPKFSCFIIGTRQQLSIRISVIYIRWASITYGEVDDIAATVQTMKQNGYETRSDIMDFHSRKLVFLVGPGGVTIELAQWH